MKEYTPARLLNCEHHNHQCDGPPTCQNPTPCPGTCPKLTITSRNTTNNPALGPTDQLHAMAWTETELRRLIHEMDRGYFDLPEMPIRKDTRFHDPLTTMLINQLQTNPIQALGILLYLGQPQAIAFQTQPPILALQDPEGSWIHIHLDTPPAEPPSGPLDPDNPDAYDDPQPAIPDTVTYHEHTPDQAQLLWTQTPATAQEAN